MVLSATVLSDIHGNLPALRAVLEQEARQPSELLVVLGDTAAGPMPNEVIDLLRIHEARLLAILGNADRDIIDIHEGRGQDPPLSMSSYAHNALRPENYQWITERPEFLNIEIDGFGKIHCCHATPRNDTEIVVVDSRQQRWDEVFAPLAEDVRMVLFGHTHMPFQRLVHGVRAINVGSVGMPYGMAGAHWMRLSETGAIETRVTTFDVESALDELERDSTFPDVRSFATPFMRGEVDDATVLTTFGARDGRLQ